MGICSDLNFDHIACECLFHALDCSMHSLDKIAVLLGVCKLHILAIGDCSGICKNHIVLAKFQHQEASMPHCEYIDRKKENMIFTPLYLRDPSSDWNQFCCRGALQVGHPTYQI